MSTTGGINGRTIVTTIAPTADAATALRTTIAATAGAATALRTTLLGIAGPIEVEADTTVERSACHLPALERKLALPSLDSGARAASGPTAGASYPHACRLGAAPRNPSGLPLAG